MAIGNSINSKQLLDSSATPEFAGAVVVNQITEFSTDGTLGDNSDLALPTEKAVKTYVDNKSYTLNGTVSEVPNGAITEFTVSSGSYISGSIAVFLNGLLQLKNTDWSETTPASGTFTFAVAPIAGDVITVQYAGTSVQSNYVLVGSQVLIGNATDMSVSLDLSLYYYIDIYMSIYNVDGGTVLYRFYRNGSDNNGTSIYTYSIGTGGYNEGVNVSSIFLGIETGQYANVLIGGFMRGVDGKSRARIEVRREQSGVIKEMSWQYFLHNANENITSVGIHSDTASAIGTGSFIYVFGMKK